MIFNAILIYTTFLLAYLSPSKSVTINVNYYGEANFELLFVTFVVPLCLYFLVRELRSMFRNEPKSVPVERPGTISSSQSAQ
jgi:hypothetical protein